MSYWTYVNGIVRVSPMGRTQAEKRYILETVLEHLPLVTGSERDMNVHIVQRSGTNESCSCDEFGETTNNLVDHFGQKSQSRGWLRVQREYILVVEGALRDRMFEQTYKEFQKWLCRLAKRIDVDDVLVEVTGYGKSSIIRNPEIRKKGIWDTAYGQMFEKPTWCQNDKEFREPNWCEYLMWDSAKGSSYPMMLGYKYFADAENDAEVERRLKYMKR